MNEIFTILMRARNRAKARKISDEIFMVSYIAEIHQFLFVKELIVLGLMYVGSIMVVRIVAVAGVVILIC